MTLPKSLKTLWDGIHKSAEEAEKDIKKYYHNMKKQAPQNVQALLTSLSNFTKYASTKTAGAASEAQKQAKALLEMLGKTETLFTGTSEMGSRIGQFTESLRTFVATKIKKTTDYTKEKSSSWTQKIAEEAKKYWPWSKGKQ